MLSRKPCILVDLYGTLAAYEGWVEDDYIGDPIAPMVEKIKNWIISGYEVKIFTARVASTSHEPEKAKRMIEQWCQNVFGFTLPVTAEKELNVVAIFDDRAIQVQPNTGMILEDVLKFYADPTKYHLKTHEHFYDEEEIMKDGGGYAREFLK